MIGRRASHSVVAERGQPLVCQINFRLGHAAAFQHGLQLPQLRERGFLQTPAGVHVKPQANAELQGVGIIRLIGTAAMVGVLLDAGGRCLRQIAPPSQLRPRHASFDSIRLY